MQHKATTVIRLAHILAMWSKPDVKHHLVEAFFHIANDIYLVKHEWDRCHCRHQ